MLNDSCVIPYYVSESDGLMRMCLSLYSSYQPGELILERMDYFISQIFTYLSSPYSLIPTSLTPNSL